MKCTKEEALEAKQLDWGWKEMGKEDGAALAFVIRNNPFCITLDLFVNEIYEEAGALVGGALKDNTKLKTLDLQQAQIGVEGGRAMRRQAAPPGHLDPCPKPHSPLSSTLAGAPPNNTLMNLKLYYNCLGPVGTTAIAEALHAPQPCAHVERSAVGIRPALSPRLQPPPGPRPTTACASQAGSALPLRWHSEPMHAP